MNRKGLHRLQVWLFTIFIIFAGLPLTVDAAEVKEQLRLADHITYKNIHYPGGKINQSIRVIEINTKDPYTKIGMGLPTSINALKKTTTFANENSREGHMVVGAINGPFFHIHGPAYQRGMPMNLIAYNNLIHQAGEVFGSKANYVNEPLAFGVSASGRNMIDYFQLDLNYIHNGNRSPITATNKVREANNTILYTSDFPKGTTETNEWGTEVVVTLQAKPTLEFGSTVTGKVTSIRKKQDTNKTTIPKNGFVLSGNGKGSDRLENVKIGDSITLEIDIDNKWKNASLMVASGPMLVKDGKVSLTMDPNSNNARTLAPRTAVAIDKTGEKVYFVTVDGRQAGYSNGMSLTEFAKYLVGLGVDRALNLDGGGSTAMAVRYPNASSVTLANKPSDGYERSIPAALMAISTAPKPLFSDVKHSHWAYADIKKLYEKSTITGYPNGTFRPDQPIRRGHVAIMLTREFKLDTKNVTNPGFKDVKTTDSEYKEIAAAANAGFFEGNEKNLFQKNAYLTRAEMAALIQRAYNIQSTNNTFFTDVQNKKYWGYEYINAIAEAGIAEGYPDGTYKPSRDVTRAEFSKFLVMGGEVK